MKITNTIKKWILKKLKHNLKEIKGNLDLIYKHGGNIIVSLVALAIGFYILKDYSWILIGLYSIDAIRILFLDTLTLIENPKYFFFTMVALLVGDAINYMLRDTLNFAISGDWLMALVYIGVWAIIKIRFEQVKKEGRVLKRKNI